MLYRTVDIILVDDVDLDPFMAANPNSLRYVRNLFVTNEEIPDDEQDFSEPGSKLYQLLESLPSDCLEEFQ